MAGPSCGGCRPPWHQPQPAFAAKLERALAERGYATANLGYPSRVLDLNEIVAALLPQVAVVAEQTVGPLHFVTHSMGGLVARVLLSGYRPPQLGRVVMLAPPNGGSEVADRLVSWAPYRRWFGPAGGQLVTRRDTALTALFGAIDYELGVIAGSRSFYPLASALMPRPNDGRVSVASTTVEGMADHLVLPVAHPTIVRSQAAIDQTLAFLTDGRFRRPHLG